MMRAISFLCRNDSDLNLALNIIIDSIPCWVQSQNERDNIRVNVSCLSYNFDFVRRQLLPFIIGE